MTSFDPPRARITASSERLVSFWLVLGMVLCCASLQAKAAAAPRALLILGDSLSAGYGIDVSASWPALLSARLVSEGYPYRVVNASISGETTAGGARRIGALLEAHHPAVVVVALGANDGLRGIDPQVTRGNLEQILGAIAAADAVAVLVQVRVPPNYGPQYTSAFEGLYPELAKAPGRVPGTFLLEGFADDPKAFQADGLHPLADRQPRILENLWPALTAAMAAATPKDSRR